jgi:hypothetical protein
MMFKSICLLFVLLGLSSYEQIIAQNHVKWEARYDKSTSEIVITAFIDKGWHLYSINNAEDLGPVPTGISIEKVRGLRLIGKTTEQEPINAFDPNFGTNVAYHENRVEFRQKVKIRKVKNLNLKVFYMVCDNAQCLPPIEVKLTINIQ